MEFKSKRKKLPVYKMVIDPDKEESGVDFIALVDNPAIEVNWFAFEKQEEFKFSKDLERRIIVAPAMIPDKPIYRRTEAMGEFYVVFDKEQIDSIQEKFNANSYNNNVNEMHDSKKIIDGIIMKNNFVSDKQLGIHPPEMFKDLPDGTWFISYKFNNEMWEEFVKTGQFKGVSVEGMFDLMPIEDTFEYQFSDLVNKITQG